MPKARELDWFCRSQCNPHEAHWHEGKPQTERSPDAATSGATSHEQAAQLRRSAARQPFCRATHLKVDTPKRDVKVNLFDLPRRHQAQCAGGQSLEAKTYTTLASINSTPPSELTHIERLLASIVNVVFHTKRRGVKALHFDRRQVDAKSQAS